jgi:hypothetical protein
MWYLVAFLKDNHVAPSIIDRVKKDELTSEIFVKMNLDMWFDELFRMHNICLSEKEKAIVRVCASKKDIHDFHSPFAEIE